MNEIYTLDYQEYEYENSRLELQEFNLKMEQLKITEKDTLQYESNIESNIEKIVQCTQILSSFTTISNILNIREAISSLRINLDDLETSLNEYQSGSNSDKCINENENDKCIDKSENDKCIDEIKNKGMEWIDKMLERELTCTKPGSISYLLHGKKPSDQSINIKMGRHGEWLSKELVKSNSNLELLSCGVQKINDKKKDVDLIFKDENKKIIYYRELKGNIELDTEKLPATISKCKEIENSLKNTHLDYSIDCGVLNWSVYNRQILSAGLSNIKTFENGGIKIDHMEDFLKIINVTWTEKDYYSYFREIAKKIDNKH